MLQLQRESQRFCSISRVIWGRPTQSWVMDDSGCEPLGFGGLANDYKNPHPSFLDGLLAREPHCLMYDMNCNIDGGQTCL